MHNIHKSQEQLSSEQGSQNLLNAVKQNGQEMSKVDESIRQVGNDQAKDNSYTHKLLTEISKKDEQGKVVDKLEELKSVFLTTNSLLKEVRDKEFPEFPEFPVIPEHPPFPDMPDMAETNRLLQQIIDKEQDISISLKLV